MSSTAGYAPARAAFPYYAPSDAPYEEWSRQLAASQSVRRPSRSSNGARPTNAMRIVKPGSTNSSPRSSILQARRRTLLSEGSVPQKRQQHIMDQIPLPMPAAALSPEPNKRAQRPMSWHPDSSHFQPQPPHAQSLPHLQPPQQPTLSNAYHLSAQGRLNDQTLPGYQHSSPMPPSYSCQTSPVTFSPLSLPSNDIHSQPYYCIDGQAWSLPPQQVPSYVSPAVDSCNISPALESNLDYSESFPPLFPATNAATTMPSADGSQGSAGSEWRSFVEHGFDKRFPPTPENLPQMQVKPAVQSEEPAPYEPLPESEDDGEILVGMGLYDAPDKHEADPGLNNYRSTLSSLLGGGAPKVPEPVGKGLKLEETWQPPESDDEDEDGDEEEETEEKNEQDEQEQSGGEKA